MNLQINKYHGTYNRSWRSGGLAAIKYICIHYTGGTGSAKNNCIYFSGGNRNASADYFVDNNGIWEYNDPNEGYYTWAVGDGKGKYGITNTNSISVEVVNNGGDFSSQEIAYLKELVPYLMKKYGVPASRVVRHYDASRKQCPAGYINSSKWNSLHAQITSGSSSNTTVQKPKEPEVRKVVNTGGDVYRLYNPNSGEHFYAFKSEADKLIAAGWKNEGVAFTAPKGGTEAVYRLYNPNNGLHFFTTSYNEAYNLEKAGWNFESVPFFGNASGKAVYRLYNPNSGDHLLTTSTTEKDNLVKLGWKNEGVGFYV